MRGKSARRAVVATAFSVLLLSATPASADNALKRAGSAIGQFFKRVGRVFQREPLDKNFLLALDSYEKGDYFTTYLYAARLRAADVPRYADEADVLMGLAAADGGLHQAAVAGLRSLLERSPTSPYYPLAVATLIDLELRRGNADAAAEAASRYIADVWERPETQRLADAKATFLESGNISSITHPRFEKVSRADRDVRYLERPADRAMYLAGTALIGAKDFAKAALLLETIEPKSPFFPYARYGLGQAYYGLGRMDDALEMFSQVQTQPGKGSVENYLRDRALLSGAQLLFEADEKSAAVSWSRHVSRKGPFGLHAALLAAEIQADDKQPALAVVYLEDRPDKLSVEPKLAARAAAFDAELRRDMRDVDTAVQRLEQGLKGLAAYSNRLANVDGEASRLLGPVEDRAERRERFQAWRRQNIANAMPDLLDGRPKPNWAARLITRAIAADPKETGYPVVYYKWPYDPFVALKPPKDLPIEPPADNAFPTVFRRSLAESLAETLSREHGVEVALTSSDDIHIGLLLLAGALELRGTLASDDAKVELGDLVELVGMPDEAAAELADKKADRDTLGKVLKTVAPLPRDLDRHSRLVAIGKDQLELWRQNRRRLIGEAVESERRAVEEIRFKLEFELSQTLGDKRERDNRAIEGS